MSNHTCPSDITGAFGSTWLPSNLTTPTCTVPDCGNNTAILVSCCGLAPTLLSLTAADFSSASTTYSPNTTYLACQPSDNTTSLPDCLLHHHATAFRCMDPNDPSTAVAASNCSAMALRTPALSEQQPGDTVCALRTDIEGNGTSALEVCGCAEAHAFEGGCLQYCLSSETGFEECVTEKAAGNVVCGVMEEDESSGGAVGRRVRSKAAVVVLGMAA